MLHVHRAERADALAGALAELLSEPPQDPFERDVVAVPTRGIERWLTQQLSARLGASAGRGDGVCANVDFPFPATVVDDALARATGLDPGEDPFSAQRSAWPLLRVVEGALEQDWLSTLAHHLGADGPSDDPRRERRYATVRRIADLYDRYAVHRPAMVRAWAAGHDVDGAGAELDQAAAWQPRLWRLLRAAVAAPSRAERLEQATGRLRAEPELVDLPRRLSLFGLTRLAGSMVEVLEALAGSREVHLFLLHPSPVLWEKVAARLPALPPPLRRTEDPTAAIVSNRLLASWGQDARELQLVIARVAGSVDHHHRTERARETLLARIQAAVVDDEPAPGVPGPGQIDLRPRLDPEDRSIQIHACHGRARQVEVLQDVILHLLQEDQTLEPRDVIVMCPDIETYAPLIQATFAAGETRVEGAEAEARAELRAPDLRVRLADRSLRETNPLLAVVATLLELPRNRLTASQVLDLADREPVRRRFAFDDDGLARIRDWISSSGIRWGLDADHRRDYGLQSIPDGTWERGLDRVLVGVSMADENHLFEGVLPLDDVGSTEIDLAGRLAEFVARLGRSLDALSGRQPAAAWRAAIADSISLLATVPDALGWQRTELQGVLDELLGDAAAERAGDLTLAEVRALLSSRLAGRPTRANFRTGHLTVCTLVPMRSVPHRVVCLLGLDDGAFPRRTPRNGDDLTLEDPHVGDRDPRIEDRQMLLDALLAAGERLVVTFTGADERTNARRPPAVPLGELLDEIDATASGSEADTAARDQVLVHHPLQSFDPSNFRAAPPGPLSFDTSALGGARSLAGERVAPPPFLDGPLDPAVGRSLDLETLVNFVQRPVRTFLRSRLGVYLADADAEPEDGLPVELDGLQGYGVGQRILEGVLSGAALEDCERAERARGTLPPGELARAFLETIRPNIIRLNRSVTAVSSDGEPSSIEINLALPGTDRRISGAVSGVREGLLLFATYARSNPRQRIAAWIRLLALTATHPETGWRAATVARAREADEVSVATIEPLAPSTESRRRLALELLGFYLDLFDRGMSEPLPLACATAEAYAQAARAGGDAEAAARGPWEGAFRRPGEDVEPEHELVFGRISCAQLLEAQPTADQGGTGWSMEISRMGRYARRLWDPLLERERVTLM